MKKIPQLIFGKQHLVANGGFLDDGEIGYQHKGCISYPAINGGWCAAEVKITNDAPIHIFSNGSEADGWFSCNCYECPKRNGKAKDAMDIRKDGGCSLELRLAIAQMDDGKIPFKTAKRIGYSSLTVQRNGVFANLSDCKEKP